MHPIVRARKSVTSLSVAFLIGALLFLLNLVVNFSDPLYQFFGGVASLRVTAYLINGLFLWLIVLLVTAFLRWRRTERERAELERVLSSISPDALLVVSPERSILMANASVKRVLGYEPEEIINRKTDLLYHDRRSRGNGNQEIYEALEREGFHVGLATGKHKDGREVPLEIVSGEMSQREGAVLLLRDISERVREEEAQERLQTRLRRQQKMESLGVLAGGIAHDFNNLLAGILGNAELAGQKLKGDPALSENLSEIKAAATRAAGLSRDMLAYAGKGRLRVQPLDLSEVVRSLSHVLEVVVPRHHKLQYDLGAGLPSVEGDAAQLQQILLYLAANATEAIGTNEGKVSVRTLVKQCDADFLSDVYADEPPPPGCYVILEIEDSGPGMDAETRARIFEPFYTTKTSHRGLGLPSVRGIVMGHRGAVKVRSETGRGTTFTVLLPCSSRAAEQLVESAESLQKSPEEDMTAWQGQGTILMIEDDQTVAAFVEQALRGAGLAVLKASDGEAGLQIFEREGARVDLTLLDMTMPKMDGRTLLAAIRKLQPDAAVILCSGDPSSVRDLTASAFLPKPYSLSVLLRTVRDNLDRRRRSVACPRPG